MRSASGRERNKESGEEFFVEAAAYRGKPVYFDMFSATQFEKEPPPPPENVGEDIWYALKFLVIIGGSVLAWRNNAVWTRQPTRSAAVCKFCLLDGDHHLAHSSSAFVRDR